MTKETYKAKLLSANEILKIQNQSSNYDEFMLGLYNGMEMIIALMEEREPVFKTAPKKWGNPIENYIKPIYRLFKFINRLYMRIRFRKFVPIKSNTIIEK